MVNIKSTGHSAYNINYHIVWCTKYRHPVLDRCCEFLKDLFQKICSTYRYSLLSLEIMPDHIHLFISVPPAISPAVIVQRLKSIAAVSVFREVVGLKQNYFWDSGLWSRGYYIGTAGSVTAESIKRYIEGQKSRGIHPTR
jgi:putative transposase